MEIVGSSEISGVVVHARGALVTRRVKVEPGVPDGDVDLVVNGITPLAEGASVRASLKGSRRALVCVQSALFVPPVEAKPSLSVEQLQEMENRLERCRTEVSRLEIERRRLVELQLSPRMGRSRRDALDTRFADALAYGGLVTEVLEALSTRLVDQRLFAEQLYREYNAAQVAYAQSTSAQKEGVGHPSRRITIRVTGAGEWGELEVTYAIPAARWWPLYTLRVNAGSPKGSLALEALVAQQSGEDWASVPLSLSTADLLLDAQLPELPSLRLGRAQTSPRPSYRAPPAGLDRLFDGYDRAFPHSVAKAELPPPPPAASEPVPDSFGEDLDGSLIEMADIAPQDEGGAGAGVLHAERAKRGGSLPPPGAPHRMAAPSASAAAPMPMMMPRSAPAAKGGFATVVGGMAMAALGAPVAAASALRSRRSSSVARGEMAASVPQDELAIEPTSGWLDFAGLRMAAPSEGGRRGRLVPGADRAENDRAQARTAIERLRPAAGLRDPRDTRGHFDHRYELQGRADVPSDGQTHRLALATGEGNLVVRLRAVPHDDPQVFREASLTNPFDAPLLAGPVDVYVEGNLLTTSALEHVDWGGHLTVGMGVDERVRVARNVRADEEHAGLLGGSTAMNHSVTIDLTSSLAAPAELELVDRMPVTDEKSVEVKLVSSSPEAQPYTQEERGQPIRGGLRWKLQLAPGAKKRVELRYRVSFNAKDELIGGNRRD